jgi:hypothetical protein
VRQNPVGTSATNCSIVPAPDDRWVWGSRLNEIGFYRRCIPDFMYQYILTPPQGLPPYRGEEVCLTQWSPESYAGGSVSSWYDHIWQIRHRVRGPKEYSPWSSRLGAERPSPGKNLLLRNLEGVQETHRSVALVNKKKVYTDNEFLLIFQLQTLIKENISSLNSHLLQSCVILRKCSPHDDHLVIEICRWTR